jgi:hypothetical protein
MLPLPHLSISPPLSSLTHLHSFFLCANDPLLVGLQLHLLHRFRRRLRTRTHEKEGHPRQARASPVRFLSERAQGGARGSGKVHDIWVGNRGCCSAEEKWMLMIFFEFGIAAIDRRNDRSIPPHLRYAHPVQDRPSLSRLRHPLQLCFSRPKRRSSPSFPASHYYIPLITITFLLTSLSRLTFGLDLFPPPHCLG